MKKRIFAISDVHGHYDEMINSLNKAGYDENNENHLLIVIGDLFDRGEQSSLIYEYLKRLTDENKAIIIKGNHEPMFIELLEGIPNMFNFLYNGTNKTIDDFYYHQKKSFEMFLIANQNEYMYQEDAFGDYINLISKSINRKYPELLSWLNSLPYYYETKDYIFTHGMIQGNCNDWKNPTIGWKNCTWAKPEDFNNSIVNTNKTIIVGHINCGLLRSLYGFDENDNSIYTRPDKKIIGIDTCTILTKNVNVLIIEDELLK